MNIDKIKNFGLNPEVKKTSPLKSSDSLSGNDKISISSQAKEMTEEVRLLSDVKQITLSTLSLVEDSSRIDKLNLIKAKLNRGEYDNISNEVAEKTANKIVDVLLNN